MATMTRKTACPFTALTLGIGLAISTAPFLHAAGQRGTAAGAAATPAEQRALVDQYCVSCHSERANVAGLNLDALDLARADTNGALMEKMVRMLRTGSMPPAGARRPDDSVLDALAGWLESSLDQHAATSPDPGRPVVRRLNRTEYTNAVRDLLGLEIDGKAMLARVVEAVAASQITQIVAVTGHDREPVSLILSPYNITNVHNSDFGDGLSTSLQTVDFT